MNMAFSLYFFCLFKDIKQSIWTYLHSKYRKLKFQFNTHVSPNDMEATNLIIINILQTMNTKIISHLHALPPKKQCLMLLSRLTEANPAHTVRNC